MAQQGQSTTHELTSSKLLAMVLTASLVGGSGSVGFIKFTSPPVAETNRELIRAIGQLSEDVVAIKRADPRPDPHTGTEARTEYGKIYTRIAENTSRTDQAIRALRERAGDNEGTLRELRVRLGLLETQFHANNDRQAAHHSSAEAWIERIRSNTKIILDNQKSRHSHRPTNGYPMNYRESAEE